ncbi:hypothetical protein ACFOG5_05075 [Pedobacter fastidiosus]|uniref:DUF4890 domain-containing protein n=1 Tax=Pedobacter fastidiosus TaxID=2765361 RepID=A0ABR7KRJ7_9SPHI|nr:hypothetical protein [Pedobacter fastidiosus]MBC6110480.1 hypothetical protein [Pedobacter fastidiosus]
MKRAILTIAIAVMGFTAAFAQDTTRKARREMPKMTAEQRAEKATAGMEKRLGLSADQKTKVYQVELDRAKKMDAMRTGNPADMKGKRGEMKASMDKSKADLDNILTSEQKTKMEALRAEQKGKMKDRKPGMGRGKKDKAPVVSNPPTQG